MDYNASDYDIVQLNEAEWGVQYNSGPLITGFTNQQKATEYAEKTKDSATPWVSAIKEPKNIDEAILFAQEERNNFRIFVGEYPNASEEQKAALAKNIEKADVQVDTYQRQLEDARVKASQKESFEQISQEQQIADADKLRKNLSDVAYKVRSTESSTPEEKAQADNAAFEAENYYNSLVENKTEVVNPTSFGLDGIFNSVSGGLSNIFGQITSPITNVQNGINNAFSNLTSVANSIVNPLANIAQGFGGNSSTITNGGTTTDNSISGTTVYDSNTGGAVSNASDMRVRIRPKAAQESIFSGILEPLKETGGVVFPYTPTIQYQAAADYEVLNTVHSNQNWHVYKNTPSIDLVITGTFTAQNDQEAKYYLAAIHFFRVMTKMHFGSSENYKGLPPPQVFLDGYGTHMFNGLSVIVKSYDIQLPNEVDYVKVESGGGVSKVPAISSISTTLTIQQTPAKARTFNWDSFASGELMQQKGWL